MVTWTTATVRAAIIFVYFFAATVWLPDLVVTSLGGSAWWIRDVVVSAVWGGALVAGMWYLRRSQRAGHI